MPSKIIAAGGREWQTQWYHGWPHDNLLHSTESGHVRQLETVEVWFGLFWTSYEEQYKEIKIRSKTDPKLGQQEVKTAATKKTTPTGQHQIKKRSKIGQN